jgi:hypothetical protein
MDQLTKGYVPDTLALFFSFGYQAFFQQGSLFIIITYFLPSKLCTAYLYVLHTFSVSKQQKKNPRKLGKTNIQNMWQEVTCYLPCRFLSKEISKAVSNSKTKSIQ